MAVGTVTYAAPGAYQTNPVYRNAPAPTAAPVTTGFQAASANAELGNQWGALTASSGSPDPNAPLQWGQSQVGDTPYGDGQCYDLVNSALTQNGYKGAPDYGKITKTADYKWGKSVKPTDAQPGDVLQFKNYHMKETRTHTNDDGSTQTQWQTQDRPHHTAMVVSNDGHGRVTVLEQNAPEGSPPHLTQLDLSNGSFQDDNGDKVKTQTSGQVSAYRPQPK